MNLMKTINVGAVIQGRHGAWTVLGTPVVSHPSTFDGKAVYKIPAYWEGNDGSHRAVTLTLHEDDFDMAQPAAKVA